MRRDMISSTTMRDSANVSTNDASAARASRGRSRRVGAVVVVAAVLALLAVAPPLKRFGRPHWATLAAVVIVLAVFAALLVESFGYVDKRVGPRLRQLEERGPQ